MVINKSVAEKIATKPSQNGNDSKLSAVKLPVIIPEKKEEEKSVLPPIEVRLKKLQKIQQLADRRETLLAALENLNDFYVTPDGNGCNLRFSDSKGKTFGIAHPMVIGEMVSLAKGKLTVELTKVESEIDFTI